MLFWDKYFGSTKSSKGGARAGAGVGAVKGRDT